MHYEHLVVINDPLEPLVDPLSRTQVWQGLMWRAEEPRAFQEHIVSSAILQRGEDWIEREIDFGAFRLRDTVRWTEGEWMRFETAAEGERPGGELTVRIEEPSEGLMVLRFTYSTTLDDSEAGAGEFASYVKSAYRELDIDTVRRIRDFADRPRPH